uniref:developmental pluripotency-associated protein 3-like n=1 Tax=Arvicanthis niloticus TaxID=61156 RepID=UPI0014865B33|nr:developmental pluripotency-associated protein 3-like [Arvicanthis niloticus]
MEEPSEKVDPVEDPETPQTKDEEDSSYDSEVLEPETLVKVMKKLNLNPSAEGPACRHLGLRYLIESRPVENKSEQILREVQSAFPKRSVRTLLSVLQDPRARMKRFAQIEQRQKMLEGTEYKGNSEPFRCLCTFCHYQGWDPSENAKIGKN